MKIVVNTRFLIKGKLEGFGRFTDEIMKRVVRAHPEHEFIFLFDRPYDASFIYADNVTPVILKPAARHPILFKIWFEFKVKRFLGRAKPDAFVSPDGYLSLGWDGPQLAVIHDLNFEHYPQDLPKAARRYLLSYFPKFAKKAERIVTVSEFSKQDIQKQYGITPEVIDVVHNGAADIFQPVTDEQKESIRTQFTKGNPYFVYLGSLHPRKNIVRLLKAFDLFKQKSGADTKLLVVGDKYWWNTEMETTYTSMQHQHEVIFTQHLAFEQMVQVLGSALGLVYVSYFEGFGLPVLEAMKCDVPVISGNRTSLPEVAGDAALMVDPFSVDDIAHGMVQLNDDADLREDLIQKGREQAKQFNWDASAKKMWESIEKTVSRG